MRGLLAAFAMMLATAASAESIKEPFMFHAAGEFEVSLKPVSAADEAPMRMSIDKQFHGDLEATSVGQMMAGGNEANGARVYVALETVTGTLKGRKGSFILAHRGTMPANGQALSVLVLRVSGIYPNHACHAAPDPAVRRPRQGIVSKQRCGWGSTGS